MKNLVQTICIVVLTVFSFNTYAQSFGIKGGLNISNMKFDWDDETTTTSFKSNIGYHVGLTAEFGNSLLFAPELLLSTKGAKVDSEFNEQTKLLYLDMHFNLKYVHDMGGAKIFGYIGPYVGLGLSGTYQYDGEVEDISFGNDEVNDWYKKTDTGLGFGGGLEFNKISIGLSYDFSLLDIAPNTSLLAKNRVFAISLGFKFNQ